MIRVVCPWPTCRATVLVTRRQDGSALCPCCHVYMSTEYLSARRKDTVPLGNQDQEFSMSVGLDLYPVLESGTKLVTHHALRFRIQCHHQMIDEIKGLKSGVPVKKLYLDFASGNRVLSRDHYGAPLVGYGAKDLVAILRKFTSEDWDRQSCAVVAFLGELPPDKLIVANWS